MTVFWFAWGNNKLKASIEKGKDKLELSETDFEKYIKLATCEFSLFIGVASALTIIVFILGFFLKSLTPEIQSILAAMIYIVSFILFMVLPSLFEPHIFPFDRKPAGKNFGIDIWNYYAYKETGKNNLSMYLINLNNKITLEERKTVREALEKLEEIEIKDIESTYKTKEIKYSRQILPAKFWKYFTAIIGAIFGTSRVVKTIISYSESGWKNLSFDKVENIIYLIITGIVAILIVTFLIGFAIDIFSKRTRRESVDEALREIFEDLIKNR